MNGICESAHGETAHAQKRGGIWYFKATGVNARASTLPRRGRFSRATVDRMLSEDIWLRLESGPENYKSKGWVAGFASSRMSSPEANRHGRPLKNAARKARAKGERLNGSRYR